MAEQDLERGIILFQQRQFQAAEDAFRGAITDDAELAPAYAWLALCLLEQKKTPQAQEAVRQSLALAPDLAFAHYVAGRVLLMQDNYPDALRAANQAIELDTGNPAYYALLAQVYLAQENWRAALSAADHGLDYDPEDDVCANIRAMALVKLNRRSDAAETMQTVLERDPENAFSHANQGWALLHANQVEPALDHFREALRLAPLMGWARTGIVEALKAQNPIYRVLLRYFLWMSTLNTQTRWGVILGLWFINRIAREIAVAAPALAPFMNIFMAAYLIFAFTTWTAPTLFNLLLRFNEYGRIVLTDEQIKASNWVAACLSAAAGLLAAGLILKDGVFSNAALMSFALILPVSSVFSARSKRGMVILSVYTVVLALFVFVSILAHQDLLLSSALGTFFWLGLVAYTWIGNLVIQMK